ncbi:helix-turn-helix transcriptional regulator [Pseudomonas syringae]|uniref:helix-turn-helix transcriptional regulator n=1 Tax=Pseudomonas syringae TaxID=317 RepID=UPI003144F40D
MSESALDHIKANLSIYLLNLSAPRQAPVDRHVAQFPSIDRDLNMTGHLMKRTDEMTGGQGPMVSELPAIVRMKRLKQMIPIGRATFYDWMNPASPRYDPTFPRPIRLSSSAKGGAVGWLESEVVKWIESRISQNG